MEDLRWAFELVDKVSGNADKMSKAVIRFEKVLGDGSKAMVTFNRNMEKTDKASGGILKSFTSLNSFGGFGGIWGTMAGAAMKVGEAFVGFAEKVADLGTEFLKSGFHAITFRQNIMTALTAIEGGNKGRAGEVFQRSLGFAQYSPSTDKTAISAMKSLRALGYSQHGAENLFAGLSDVATRAGSGDEGISGMLLGLSEAKAIGAFHMRHIQMVMQHGAGSGLTMGAFLDTLSKSHPGMSKHQLSQQLSSGAISADEGMVALLETIRTQVSGGKLGQATLNSAGTFENLSSAVESLPQRLWYNLTNQGAGEQGIETFMQNILDSFNKVFGEGGSGNLLLQRFVDDVGTWLGSIDVETMTAKFEKVIATVSEMYEQAKADFPAVKAAVLSVIDAFGGWDGAVKTVHYLAKGLEMALYAIEGIVKLVNLGLDLGNFQADLPAKLIGHFLEKNDTMLHPELVSSIEDPGVSRARMTSIHGDQTQSVEISAPITVNAPGGDANAISKALGETMPDHLQTAASRLSIERGNNVSYSSTVNQSR